MEAITPRARSISASTRSRVRFAERFEGVSAGTAKSANTNVSTIMPEAMETSVARPAAESAALAVSVSMRESVMPPLAPASAMASVPRRASGDALDIQSWEVTSLPEGAEKTGSANVSYSGTDATITTYDDPSVVTVTAMGQDITLAVPDSAQTYLPFLSYLG